MIFLILILLSHVILGFIIATILGMEPTLNNAWLHANRNFVLHLTSNLARFGQTASFNRINKRINIMPNPFDYSDKTVVVVGGTSGINRGIAELFAQHGARVAVASRSQDKVDDTVAALKTYDIEAMGFSADVRNSEAINQGLQQVHKAFGDFDVVVSGAAGNFPAMAMGMSANAFRSVIEIDLLGTFHVMQGAYPYLKKPGASVINISASSGLDSHAGAIPCVLS